MPVTLKVDLTALQQAFYQNSKKYHPDFHSLADPAEQDRVLELSSQNNIAYNTLRDMDRRIQYVLNLKQLIGDESTHPPLSQTFLMDMMDINETLMELEFDFDAERYKQVNKAVQELEQQLTENIRPVLDSWTEAAGGMDALLQVRDYFLKKKYLLRILENLSKFASAN